MLTSIDGDDDEVSEGSNVIMNLEEIADLTGSLLIKNPVKIERKNLLDEGCFVEREPNDSDYGTPEPEPGYEFEEPEPRSDEGVRYYKDWVGPTDGFPL